jgi:ABC-type Fe3+-siderophore transport system permease subunit
MGAGTGVGGFLAAWAQGIRCFGEEDMRQWLLWLAHAEGRASWADLD